MTRWTDATGGRWRPRLRGPVRRARGHGGADVHGEAALCAALVPVGSRILDAGCGTGRVAIRLAELGYDCTGTDLDPSMLAVARERAPQLRWVEADLSTLDLLAGGDPAYDLVVLAGNVVPLAAAGTEPAVVARVAAHLRPGGLLVAGLRPGPGAPARRGRPGRAAPTTTPGARPPASSRCGAWRPGTASRTTAAATPSASTPARGQPTGFRRRSPNGHQTLSSSS